MKTYNNTDSKLVGKYWKLAIDRPIWMCDSSAIIWKPDKLYKVIKINESGAVVIESEVGPDWCDIDEFIGDNPTFVIADEQSIISPLFNEVKLTEIVAIILDYVENLYPHHLYNILYLIDRESIIRSGHPITYDTYICSSTGVDSIEAKKILTKKILAPNWNSHMYIYQSIVKMSRNPETQKLSDAEISVIRYIANRHGNKGIEELATIISNYPEWKPTSSSNRNVNVKHILPFIDKFSADDIDKILDEIKLSENMERMKR